MYGATRLSGSPNGKLSSLIEWIDTEEESSVDRSVRLSESLDGCSTLSNPQWLHRFFVEDKPVPLKAGRVLQLRRDFFEILMKSLEIAGVGLVPMWHIRAQPACPPSATGEDKPLVFESAFSNGKLDAVCMGSDSSQRAPGGWFGAEAKVFSVGASHSTFELLDWADWTGLENLVQATGSSVKEAYTPTGIEIRTFEVAEGKRPRNGIADLSSCTGS